MTMVANASVGVRGAALDIPRAPFIPPRRDTTRYTLHVGQSLADSLPRPLEQQAAGGIVTPIVPGQIDLPPSRDRARAAVVRELYPRAGCRRDDLQPGVRSLAAGEYIVLYRVEGDDVAEDALRSRPGSDIAQGHGAQARPRSARLTRWELPIVNRMSTGAATVWPEG